jgi:GT2 family glycosyltransferase
MNISIIIPNYNGEEILEKNLSSVLSILSKYKNGEKELIVIDDASRDSSVKIIQQLFERFKDSNITTTLLENKRNVGFSPTVNTGITIARGEILILLNTDVIPEDNFIEPLLTHFSDESVFAVGCLERSVEGETIDLYGRGLGKWEHGFLVHRAGDVNEKNTLWVSCGSGAFRKTIWEKLGGLNEVYAPFYWEDIDLSYRALKCGYTVVFDSKSVVTHRHVDGAIKKTQKSSYIRSIATRNQFLFVWNNVTDTSLVLSHIFSLPIHIARAIRHGDLPFIIGFFKAIGKFQNVITYRSHMIKHFKKSDAEVIREVNK